MDVAVWYTTSVPYMLFDRWKLPIPGGSLSSVDCHKDLVATRNRGVTNHTHHYALLRQALRGRPLDLHSPPLADPMVGP